MKTNISIILPAYNSEKYIGKSIKSILNQTFLNFELIIIVDPSSDNTIREIKKFKDKRIILITNKKKLGLPACLNLGIRKSKSDLIARADSDDYYFKNRLKSQYNFLSERKDIDLVGSNALFLEDGKFTKLILPTSRSLIKWYMLFKCPFLHPTIMLRKKIFYKYGLYPLKKYEDYLLYSKIIDKIKFTNLEEALCVIRKHGDNISNHKNKLDNLGEIKIYKNYIKKLYKINISNTVLSMLIYMRNAPKNKKHVNLTIKKIKEIRKKFLKKNSYKKKEINAINTEVTIKIIFLCIKHQAYSYLLLNAFYIIKLDKFFLYYFLKKIINKFLFKKDISFVNY